MANRYSAFDFNCYSIKWMEISRLVPFIYRTNIQSQISSHFNKGDNYRFSSHKRIFVTFTANLLHFESNFFQRKFRFCEIASEWNKHILINSPICFAYIYFNYRQITFRLIALLSDIKFYEMYIYIWIHFNFRNWRHISWSYTNKLLLEQCHGNTAKVVLAVGFWIMTFQCINAHVCRAVCIRKYTDWVIMYERCAHRSASVWCWMSAVHKVRLTQKKNEARDDHIRWDLKTVLPHAVRVCLGNDTSC